MDPLKGKSITTSVPSIAIRFHTGDEEVDIYPSADDEEEDEKEEEGTSPATASPSVTPSIPSRDPSPMKEYLRGLGKRSTSVDGGMADASGSSSDTWRIFHELKGKITKTVEEKLTEMKNDRKASGTPILSGLKNRRRRLRAGGFDNSSISDSEDISEASNKGENKEPISTETSQATDANETNAGITNSIEDSSVELDHSTKKRKKPRKKIKTEVKFSPGNSDLSEAGSSSSQDPIESGVEISEDTKFPSEEDYEDIPTIDYRTDPPTTYNSPNLHSPRPALIIRESSAFLLEYLQVAWFYRYLMIVLVVIYVYFFYPLSQYLCGLIMGIFLTLTYHFTVGMSTWSDPVDFPMLEPFSVPDYKAEPILETPPLDDMILTPTKCAGWMNELPTETYDSDTYHINNTQTVYVHLEGSTLKISHPRSKVQRRATWNEKKYKMKFVHQRIYSLAGCTVQLLPDGLTRKRTWSKKYPICITLTKESLESKSVLNLTQLPISSVEDKDFDQHSVVSGSQTVSREISANSLFENAMEDVAASEMLSELRSDVSIDSSKSATPTPSIQEPKNEPSATPSDDDTFCLIDNSVLYENHLFLFARTDRQKEDWYARLVLGIRSPPREVQLPQDPPEGEVTILEPEVTFDAAGYTGPEFVARTAHEMAPDEYLTFMNRFHLQLFQSSTQQPRDKKESRPTTPVPELEVDCDVMWINAMVGHVLYDILKSEMWRERIVSKIQKKLEMIKLPYFMETLLLRDVEFGQEVPMIHRASRPIIDGHGLWVDLDVSFNGRISLTLETKLNLMKLKTTTLEHKMQQQGVEVQPGAAEAAVPNTSEKSKSPIYDSEIEDTAESSETDEAQKSNPTSSDSGGAGKSTELSPSKKALASGSKGMIRMMNKIVASKYFQQATEIKYIKRAMEGVSNTTITLVVEIRGLTGQLALNMPPPPSDRLWYGFRGNPKIWISARPKFGDRHLNIRHVVNWIEKKLIQEFQKKLVLPNMDDLVITPMSPQLPK